MLCSPRFEDIFDGDGIKCVICRKFLYFAYASFLENSVLETYQFQLKIIFHVQSVKPTLLAFSNQKMNLIFLD